MNTSKHRIGVFKVIRLPLNTISPSAHRDGILVYTFPSLAKAEQFKVEFDSLHPGYFIAMEATEVKKLVTLCPNCSQKLRVPSNIGGLTLTCPKCRSSWLGPPE